MINIDNLNKLSLYEVDLLIKQIKNSPEREDNLQKVMDRRNEIINTSKLGNEVPEDISNMSLKELYEQRELLNDNGKKELDGKVVAKANKEYANGKGVILTAEELYILRDLLDKASDIGYNGKPKDINKCKQKVSRYIDNFEDYYGINKQLLSPDKVKENLETIEKNVPSVKDLLNREALKNVKNVLDNLVITGEQGVLSQKNIKGEEAEKIKNLWMEKVYQETTMYLANTRKEKISDEVFAQEFSDRMKLAILQAQSSKEAVKVALSKVNNPFERLIKNLEKQNKKVEIGQKFLAANLAKANVDENAAITRLGEKPQYAAVADTYKGKNKELDEKCKKQHKTLYILLKTAAKSGAWGAAYGVGAAFGPAGVAIVASASCINAIYGVCKDYKKQKKDDQTLDVVKYMRKNPTRVAGVVLSAASAITGGLANPEFTAYSQVLMRGSAISLGAANAVKAYRDAPKGKKWKAALTAAGSFAVGFVAGRAGADVVNLADVVDFSEFGNSAQAGGVGHIEDYKPLEEVGPSPQQLQDNQPVGGNDSHHNHHDSNAQGPGGEGETDAPSPEVTESKITTHILEPGEEYQFGGCRFTETEGYETTIHEGYTAGEEKYVKVSFLENETGEREDLFVGEKNGVISQERYDDQGNIYESTVIKDGQELKTEYQYNEDCKLSEELRYDSEGYLKERVEITYNENGDTVYRHLNGDGDHIKTVIKDSNGIMTEQTTDNNDVALDDNNRDSADSVVSNGNANLNDATPQGGEIAGVGNNNAVPEGITAEQTNGNDDNTEKQSDGKLSEEEVAEILKQRMREQGAVDAAYKEHFQDARDVEKLFYTQKIFNMDNQLHGMESAGQQDTPEHKELESNLNGELKKIDMVRDEETGEIMNMEKYAALQEQRQAEAQAGENAGENNNAELDNSQTQDKEGSLSEKRQSSNEAGSTTLQGGENAGVDNSNAGQEDITAKQTTGNTQNLDNLTENKQGQQGNSQTGHNPNQQVEEIDAKKLAEMYAQSMREQGAVEAAYKEHFPNARDVEKLFFTQAVSNMDMELHKMESAGQQDTPEYKELEGNLNNKLKEIDMVRGEKGEIMSMEKYAALQEQRQAEAQAGTQAAEKADTTKDNNADQKSSEVKNIADHIKKLSGIDGGGKIHGANETQTHVAKNTNIPKNFPIGNAGR